jgi:hypothetical protein
MHAHSQGSIPLGILPARMAINVYALISAYSITKYACGSN